MKGHKLWTDDYLAAFAQAGDTTLVTLDRKLPTRYPSVRVELLLPNPLAVLSAGRPVVLLPPLLSVSVLAAEVDHARTGRHSGSWHRGSAGGGTAHPQGMAT
jgi:hypothetical protein